MAIKKIQHTVINPFFSKVPKDQTDIFTTTDLGCAAALMSSGYPLYRHQKNSAQKVDFLFVRHESVEELARAYFADELWIKARAYKETMKMLKNLIHTT